MSTHPHFQKLVKMYARANINAIYQPLLSVAEGQAEVSMAASEKFFHSAGAVHASFYFKALDDAAWFAAATLEHEFFVLTTAFTTYITRPMSTGRLRAVGRVVNRNNTQFIVESIAYDSANQELARATGIVVRSKVLLSSVLHYADEGGGSP